ncbi:hypothetical protein Tco_0066506 [Tanacetum coccineum]
MRGVVFMINNDVLVQAGRKKKDLSGQLRERGGGGGWMWLAQRSKPNGKLLVNFILHGPYVRRMIIEPGDPDCDVHVAESFHEQTDDELTKKEAKHMEADDQAIQTILIGLPEDIYAAVDSCDTAQEIRLRVQQMMKGSNIGLQEKKAKLFNEWENFKSIEGESIESYYHQWKRHVIIVHQTKDLHEVDYINLYDFLKFNQAEVNEIRAEWLAKTHDPLALMANSQNPYNYPVGTKVRQNAVQNLGIQNVGNRNRLIVVSGIANQNANQNGNEEGSIARTHSQTKAKGRCLSSDLGILMQIEESIAHCNLMENLEGGQPSIDIEIHILTKLSSTYTKLLEDTSEPHLVKQDDNNVILIRVVNTHYSKPSILGKPPSRPFNNQKLVRKPTAFQSERTESSKTQFILKVDVNNDLTKPVTSHSVSDTQESKVVKNDKLIAPRMFRINTLQNSRVDKVVPNKPVNASIRTKLITFSQPHVITKQDINSNSNGLSSTGVESASMTRRPEPSSNTKNDRVPSASKSSCINNKEVEVIMHVLLTIKNPQANVFQIPLLFLAGCPNLFMVHQLGLLQAYDRESEAAHQLHREVYGNCSLWK